MTRAIKGLGKCQRLIKLLRQAGYDRTIWLHGALKAMCDLYAEFWQRGILSQEIKEMTRIRNARITDCGY